MRDDNIQIFTSDMLEKMAYIWTRSSISLMDVRHQSIAPEQPLRRYKMPSSTMVYAYGGAAAVQLDKTIFAMERFGLFHGKKGTHLSISPEETKVGCYMVLYKAETPPLFKKDLQRLLEQINPFVQQFGCAPSNPVRLLYLFQQMMDNWSRANAMDHFHTRNLFYQSVQEIYRDLEQEEAMFLQPDPVTAAKRYLDEHYMQAVWFQEIADMFAISGGQLTRLFKKKTGKSLQEYLTMKRLDAAKYQLVNTNATIREIAYGCGFVDENTLFRMFKKYFKVSPGDYRKKVVVMMQGYTIDNDYQHLYNEIGLDQLVKSQRDGEFTMFGQIRGKQMILAAALSLMLLLSACAAAPANTNGAMTNTTVPAATATAQTPAETKAEAAWPRTHTDASGANVVIDKQPERVAVLHFGMVEMVYALGAQIIASPMLEHIGEMVTLQPLLRDAELIELGSAVNPDLEKLIDASPDLILGWKDYHAEAWDSLGQIAPLASMLTPYDHSYKETLREHGRLLGREERAEQLIAEIDGKLSAAREQLSSLNETVVALSYWDNGQTGWVANSAYTSFYNQEEGLGLKAPEQLLDSYSEAISLEGLATMDPDHIYIRGTQETFEQTVAELAKSKVWNTLTAVRQNQVYPIEESTFNGGPLGIQLWADYAVETLLK